MHAFAFMLGALLALLVSSTAASAAPSKCVALTFDDGPHPTLTPKLLSILEKEKVVATFFVVGQLVEKYPTIVKRAYKAGHEIGNHSWSHPNLRKLEPLAAEGQIRKTDAAIVAATGTTPRVLRAPYGSMSRSLARHFDRAFISWDVDTYDWRVRNSDRVVQFALRGTRGGSIVLMHDIHEPTVTAVPRIITGLKKLGFQFTTVSGLRTEGCKPLVEARAQQ